jgi:hypothetical protein
MEGRALAILVFAVGCASADTTPPDAACPSAGTCMAAMMLGTLSGDTVGTKLEASGTQATWLQVRVTEDNSEMIGVPMRLSVKLMSPLDVDFDAFIHLNTATDVLECVDTLGDAMTSGKIEETRIMWGDGMVPNGLFDDRDVLIEVRPVSGGCESSGSWQLEIAGNWR